jgi:aspartate carbamoyltransferase catalytic subunit
MRVISSINDLDDKEIEKIFSLARKNNINNRLDGKILVNFFFENSTRTRLSFEIAGKNLGMKVVNIDVANSSLSKGESFLDTIATINTMKPSVLVLRHNGSGIINLAAKHLDCLLINAGDGCHEHPTQALVDCFTLLEKFGSLKNKTIVILGDYLHSRVARSDIKLLVRLGAKVKVISPKSLTPLYNGGVEIYHNFEQGLKNADAVIVLRVQKERMDGFFIPSFQDYACNYKLTHERLKFAKKGCFVLHPAPINRDVEIDSDLADDLDISLILKQAENGVKIREALIAKMLIV